MFNIKDYITVSQAAEVLGYSTANVTRLIRSGKLPALKRGRRYLVLPSDIDKYTGMSEMFK